MSTATRSISMANLSQKDGIYLIRFRYREKEYKRSLKTRSKTDADGAKAAVETTIHRLLIGLLQIPPEIDPGDFIVSGGTCTVPSTPIKKPDLPSTRLLTANYLKAQEPVLAPSYQYSQGVHLRHLLRHLGSLADEPCDRVGRLELESFLHRRLTERDPGTVAKERVTLREFYKWLVNQEHLAVSPAATLPTIKGGSDRPPFRTIGEIQRIINRGGLSDDEINHLWECLFLSPQEIAGLLATVRDRAKEDFSHLLHVIPAYTGIRRGEVLRLRWIDVDLDEGYICARSRKQSRSRTEVIRRIDVHPELKQILLEWRKQRRKGQHVVCDGQSLEPLEKDRANRCFWQPMRGTDWCLDSKKNWFKVGFHTYRHSFASNLAALGIDQRIVDEFMGHQTEAMRRRYRHLFPKNRRSAIESFSLGKTTETEESDAP